MRVILALILMTGIANAQTYNPSAPNAMPNGSTGTPTIATGPAAGTSSASAIAGTNASGSISVTTGTGTTTGAILATITFGGSYSPSACTITPQNTNSVGQTAMVYATKPVSNVWTISIGGSPLPASITSYLWSYVCI